MLHNVHLCVFVAEEREDSIAESFDEEAVADPTPPTTDSPLGKAPSDQQIGQSATSTAAQVESDAPGVQIQEEEPSGAESSAAVVGEEEEAKGEGAKISASGMQGSVAESSASSNARQHSTSSAATSTGTTNSGQDACSSMQKPAVFFPKYTLDAVTCNGTPQHATTCKHVPMSARDRVALKRKEA